MEKKRIGYLEILRIAACILVVGVHVSAFSIEQLDVTGVNFKVMNGFDCISILGVPLFVMVSGALLLSEEYPNSIRKFYLHKIPRLLFLFFFWLLFYNTVDFIEQGKAWSLINVRREIVLNSLLGKGIYHLWFLPMMVLLYLATPFIKSFAADKKRCILFCVLFFAGSVFVPTMLKFEFPYRTIVEGLYEQFNCAMFAGYIGFYLLGHIIHAYCPVLSKKILLGLAALGIVSMGIEIYVCNLYSEKTGALSTILNTPFSVNACIACICIFIMCKHLKFQGNRFTAGLSKLTLGIYLVHPFVLYLYKKCGFGTLFAPAAVAIPLVVLLVASISALIVFLISKIPGLRKII